VGHDQLGRVFVEALKWVGLWPALIAIAGSRKVQSVGIYIAVASAVLAFGQASRANDEPLERIRRVLGENASASDFDKSGRITVQIDEKPADVLRVLSKLDERDRSCVEALIFTCVIPKDSPEIRLLERLPKLRELHVDNWSSSLSEFVSHSATIEMIWAQRAEVPAGITGKDLALICQAKQLRLLMIEGNRLTAADLAPLSNLTELFQLNLSGFDIETKDVTWLASMTKLSTLWLSDTNVDDAIVPILSKCSNLKILALTRTNVSKEGAAKLRRELPETIISTGGKGTGQSVAPPKGQ
jgi:hypothetical protein